MKNIEICLSDSARRVLREMQVGGDYFLRLSVRPGGCAGMTYEAWLDSEFTQEDRVVYDLDDFRIVVGDRILTNFI